MCHPDSPAGKDLQPSCCECTLPGLPQLQNCLTQRPTSGKWSDGYEGLAISTQCRILLGNICRMLQWVDQGFIRPVSQFSFFLCPILFPPPSFRTRILITSLPQTLSLETSASREHMLPEMATVGSPYIYVYVYEILLRDPPLPNLTLIVCGSKQSVWSHAPCYWLIQKENVIHSWPMRCDRKSAWKVSRSGSSIIKSNTGDIFFCLIQLRPFWCQNSGSHLGTRRRYYAHGGQMEKMWDPGLVFKVLILEPILKLSYVGSSCYTKWHSV